ncbi:LPS translocon maturation chaperone LptM [Pseudaeromonas pectinilytica]|nr:lipoprotein [Aeromonadaceae bacterium]
MLVWTGVLLALTQLTACGLKGPLKMPEEESKAASSQQSSQPAVQPDTEQPAATQP